VKRVVRTTAAIAATAAAVAATSALLSPLGVTEARGQLVYDSFNYPAATALENKVNAINGQPWSTMSANPGVDDNIVLSSGSVSYPGLAAASGNSASYGGTGKTERIGFDKTARSGQMYYSMVLRVSDVAALTTTPTFIAGFSDRAGESGVQPTTVGTRLYLRKRPSPPGSTDMFQIGVSKNSSFDITFDDPTEYAINTPLLIVGSYEVVGTGSGTNDIARLYINPTSLGSASAPTTSTAQSPILTAPVTGTDLTVSGVPSLAGFVLRQGSSAATSVPNVQIDELRIDSAWARATAPAGVTWNSSGGGAWSDASKWSPAASPNNADAFVNFNGTITAPSTVDVDGPVALRMITFNSNQPYTLGAGGGGAGALNFSASSGVNVRSGSHTIAAPITLGGEMLFSVATGASLNLTGAFSGGANTIMKAGDGAMTMKHLRGGNAEVIAGSLAIAPDGGPAGTGNVTSLAVAADAVLDLSNNDLVVDYSGGAGNSPIGTPTNFIYSGLTGAIASAINSNQWDGPGIRTSQAAAKTGLTTIGIGEAAALFGLAPGETALWSGQTIDDTSVLIRYTYAGDGNLDGVIDGGDYGIIDNNVTIPGASGYANGDFNLDGVIDGGDYGIIDNNITAQGAPLGDSAIAMGGGAMGSVTVVPEPSMCVAASVVTIAAGLLARRRR
jgi:hypothetical protein